MNTLLRTLTGLCLSVGLLSSSGCATPPPATEFRDTSYLLGNRLYTFAIYNDDGRLITDPFFDFKEEVGPQEGTSITDVYLITHGWNFTIQESIANFHGYMEMVDQSMKTVPAESTFRPFAIFVSWPSVSRPVGDIAKAVLPFELDTHIQAPTTLIDRTAFFLPSVWKQTLNAMTVAIGTYPPDYYFLKNRGQLFGTQVDPEMPTCEPIREGDTGAYGVRAKEPEGRDCPVSALLFTLMKWKELYKSDLRIHIVGHSFGAKLATLATVEALRRWEMDISPFNGAGPPAPSPNHTALCQANPVESLVLFNPAFNHREITYGTLDANSFLPSTVFPVPYLQCIPRKAIVYSRRDHATGGMFNLSQIVMDNRANTFIHQRANWLAKSTFLHRVRQATAGAIHIPKNDVTDALYSLVTTPFNVLIGTLDLASAFAFGPLTWAGNTVVQFPQDLAHHISTGNCILRSSPTAGIPEKVARGFVNSLDFFLPLCHFLPIRHPFPDDADNMGVLRSTMPALGNTGLDKLEAGREWPSDDWAPMIDAASYSTDRSRTDFCHLAVAINLGGKVLHAGTIQEQFLYSFDGAEALNTLVGLSGAHGDLREKDIACGCNVPLQKRELVFNFTVNFTKGSR